MLNRVACFSIALRLFPFIHLEFQFFSTKVHHQYKGNFICMDFFEFRAEIVATLLMLIRPTVCLNYHINGYGIILYCIVIGTNRNAQNQRSGDFVQSYWLIYLCFSTLLPRSASVDWQPYYSVTNSIILHYDYLGLYGQGGAGRWGLGKGSYTSSYRHVLE